MEENLQKNITIVFKKHYREFCLLAYSYVSCSDLAQEIVQDIFVRILMNGEATEISNLKGYIWKSVKYESLKHVRCSKRLVPLKKNIPVLTLDEEERSHQD